MKKLVNGVEIEMSPEEVAAFLADQATRWQSVADGQLDIIATADRAAKEKRDSVTARYSSAEMASWPIKRAEALAYQESGLPADAPSLTLEAGARGIPLDDLVGKVLNKSTLLSQLEAGIAGRCGAIQDAARAAGSIAELEAIDVNAGWPI